MAHKQRQFSAKFKWETALETLRGEKGIAPTCPERQITDSLVDEGRQEFLEKAPFLLSWSVWSGS